MLTAVRIWAGGEVVAEEVGIPVGLRKRVRVVSMEKR
jgi:hypothetical protein